MPQYVQQLSIGWGGILNYHAPAVIINCVKGDNANVTLARCVWGWGAWAMSGCPFLQNMGGRRGDGFGLFWEQHATNDRFHHPVPVPNMATAAPDQHGRRYWLLATTGKWDLTSAARMGARAKGLHSPQTAPARAVLSSVKPFGPRTGLCCTCCYPGPLSKLQLAALLGDTLP